MKTIGILGGMGWEASAEYYRRLNELCLQRHGNMASAEMILSSVNNRLVGQMMYRGQWDELCSYLQGKITALEKAGVDYIVMACNSVHYLADRLNFTVPFLHIADAVAKEAISRGDSKLMLLGTKFTCQEDFYRQRLESHGLEVLIPRDNEIAEIHRFIYTKLKTGSFPDSANERFREIVLSFEKSVGSIVLACTELPLLLGNEIPDTCLDTIELHCQAIMDYKF